MGITATIAVIAQGFAVAVNEYDQRFARSDVFFPDDIDGEASAAGPNPFLHVVRTGLVGAALGKRGEEGHRNSCHQPDHRKNYLESRPMSSITIRYR